MPVDVVLIMRYVIRDCSVFDIPDHIIDEKEYNVKLDENTKSANVSETHYGVCLHKVKGDKSN